MNKSGLIVNNLLFSVVNINPGYFPMNFGLFWEPGAYQTFINLALFFQMFILRELKYKYILVYLLTVFTTFSTTGYLGAAIILIAFFFSNRMILDNRKKILAIILTGLVLSFIISYNYLPDIIKFKVFGKLEAILNSDLAIENSSYTSTTIRTDSIKYPLFMAFENPFFGVGFSNLYQNALDIGFKMVTATPVNWLALFGIPLGLLLNMCVYQWTKLVKGGVFFKILIFIFLLIIVISENYNRDIFYLMFLLYSFDIKSINKISSS
ncbi:O-antigen ligase family protein [Solibacillus sp. FSL K6-4121]|uniref:O-antigen ligase family protein n=1 Tax=Solibacillus sp. FSL K6-4121 TaxID=2921505 RepID=UPI0030FAB4D0